MRERPVTVDIADRPQAFGRAQVRVDRDPALIRLDAHRLQAEAVDARTPTGRDEQALAAQLAAVDLQDVVLPATARRGGLGAEDELDAVPSQHLREGLAERRRLAAQQMSATLDEDDFTPEAADGLRHLHADRPAPEDQQAARNGLHPGRFAVRPDALELSKAGNRGHDRVGAVRDHDVVGAVTDAVDLHRTRSGEAAAATEQLDPLVGQPPLLPGVGVIGDHEIPPRKHRLDIDLRTRRRRRGPRELPRPGAAAS